MTILIFIFLTAGRNFSQLLGLISFHTLIFGFFASRVQKHQNTLCYSPDRPKLVEISARSFKTGNDATEMDTFEVFCKVAEIEASFSIGSIGNMHVYIHLLTLLAEISASFLV